LKIKDRGLTGGGGKQCPEKSRVVAERRKNVTGRGNQKGKSELRGEGKQRSTIIIEHTSVQAPRLQTGVTAGGKVTWKHEGGRTARKGKRIGIGERRPGCLQREGGKYIG